MVYSWEALDTKPSVRVESYLAQELRRLMPLDDALSAAKSQSKKDNYTVLCFYADGRHNDGSESVTVNPIGTKSVFWYEYGQSGRLTTFLQNRRHWGRPDDRGRYVEIRILNDTGADITENAFSRTMASIAEDEAPTPWKLPEHQAESWTGVSHIGGQYRRRQW